MQKHEEYESLCAQALIGQLSPEEYSSLLSHMQTCDSCCRAAHEFVDVMQHLPIEVSEASSERIRDLQEEATLQHFIFRAQGEGVVFSRATLEPEPVKFLPFHILSSRIIRIPLPAFAALVLAFGGFTVLAYRYRLGAATPVKTMASTSIVAGPLNSATPTIDKRVPELEAQLEDTHLALKAAQQNVNDLNSRLEINDQKRSFADAEAQNRASALAQLTAKYSQQEQQLAQEAAEKNKIESDRDRMLASLVTDETRLRDLQSQLTDAHAEVEQERELNAAARDVRELMGARNLHIVDVYDSQSSRENRSFGRIMYQEGKSLIFYAFDLDKAKNVKKVSFQAWGEREGEHRDPKKLGVFYIDDAVQKRWVLKVNDPEKLKSIDTVFVTVENHTDADAPNHQRLLQAYLGSAANHP